MGFTLFVIVDIIGIFILAETTSIAGKEDCESLVILCFVVNLGFSGYNWKNDVNLRQSHEPSSQFSVCSSMLFVERSLTC